MSTADASRAALRADGETILRKAIRAVLPDGALRTKRSPHSRAVWS